jgi:vacuolar-type H+-ATPase subunit I/STV1
MAVRQSPNTGLIVTLIVFVTAFIVCLVLAIMFYTKIEEHRTAAAAARTELEKFIEPARRNAAEMNQYAAAGQRMQPPRKIVSYLESELNRLKLITAGADMDIARIESELQSAGAAEGQNALEVIRQLKTERDSAQQQVAQLQEQIRTVESQIADLQKMRDRIDAAAQAQREQLLADLGKLRQDVESLDAGQKQALAAVSQRVEEARTGYEEERQKLDNQLRDRQRDLDDLRKRIALFEGSLKKETPSVPNPSVNVDGEIIGIPPEKSVVYINLGRKDHLVLGMTFEVFGAARGVEIEEGDDGRVLRRGKATIEVVSMADNSAVGRIVRQPRVRQTPDIQVLRLR